MSVTSDDEIDNQRPLMDNFSKFEQISEKISENIGVLKEYIDVLEECRSKMGTPDDTRNMRGRMNNEITDANYLIKILMEQFEELEELKFRRKKDIDNYRKITRRLKNTFDDDYEEFTRILKEIHSREKIFLQIKQSLALNASQTSETSAAGMIASQQHRAHDDGSFFANNLPDNDAPEQVVETNDLEFYASIIHEREEQLHNVKKLANEMNMFAQAQAERINEQEGDLENLVEHTTGAVENTEKGNRELDKTVKNQRRKNRNQIIFTVIIIIVCIVIVSILLATLAD